MAEFGTLSDFIDTHGFSYVQTTMIATPEGPKQQPGGQWWHLVIKCNHGPDVLIVPAWGNSRMDGVRVPNIKDVISNVRSLAVEWENSNADGTADIGDWIAAGEGARAWPTNYTEWQQAREDYAEAGRMTREINRMIPEDYHVFLWEVEDDI